MGGVLYSGERPELLRFLDVRQRSVLDVGCGAGGLAPHLRSAGATRVVGVERDTAHAAAAAHLCDAVFASSVEAVLRDSLLGSERFGLILLADVLEHLIDPWAVIRGLVEQHLSPGGLVFISVPNVANVNVIKQLLVHCDWRYDESGMFDRTHLRWFGVRSLSDLISQAGLESVQWGGRLGFGAGRFWYTRVRNDISHFPPITVFQFHVLARLADAGPQAQEFDRLNIRKGDRREQTAQP
jgi:SAM-dependent methyltransferase